MESIPSEEVVIGDKLFGLWEVIAIQRADNFGQTALQFTFPDRTARLVVNVGINVPVAE